jgi:hypothetical protein
LSEEMKSITISILNVYILLYWLIVQSDRSGLDVSGNWVVVINIRQPRLILDSIYFHFQTRNISSLLKFKVEKGPNEFSLLPYLHIKASPVNSKRLTILPSNVYL